MNIQNNEEKEKKVRYVDIYPAKLTRRFLTLLADLCFILITSIFLLEFVTEPIAKVSTGYSDKTYDLMVNHNSRIQILYDNNLLFYEKEEDKFAEELNLVTTSDKFIKYYTYEENEDYETIYHYYKDIKDYDVSKINEIYKKVGEKYFDFTKYTKIGTYAFNDRTKELLRPKFVSDDKLSQEGEKLYQEVQSKLFLSLYHKVISDIEIKENDLTSPIHSDLKSFNTYLEGTKEFNDYYNNILVISTVISFLISTLIYFFIVPLCLHKGQTVSEIILKLDTVDTKTIQYLSKKNVFIKGIFDFINSTSILFAIPSITLGFSGLFSLPYLLGISLVGIVFLIIEGIFTLSTKLNQSLKQFSTHSIVCETQTIDEYYKELGYE